MIFWKILYKFWDFMELFLKRVTAFRVILFIFIDSLLSLLIHLYFWYYGSGLVTGTIYVILINYLDINTFFDLFAIIGVSCIYSLPYLNSLCWQAHLNALPAGVWKTFAAYRVVLKFLIIITCLPLCGSTLIASDTLIVSIPFKTTFSMFLCICCFILQAIEKKFAHHPPNTWEDIYWENMSASQLNQLKEDVRVVEEKIKRCEESLEHDSFSDSSNIK